MPADSIVKILNVIKHIRLGFLAKSIDMSFDALLLHAAEEGLGNCIIPTVSSATYAGNELVVVAPTIEVITAKLATLVRVNHHGSLR